MSKMLTELSAWGCDVKGALGRMDEDEGFYAECLQEVADDRNFAVLRKALDDGDTAAAFDAAHTLKGVFANVGLTPMFNKIVEIVEPLRAGSNQNMSAEYSQLMEMRGHLKIILLNQ